MDDIGNIIYLIFILISLIGGVWQNFSKQKKEAKSRPEARPSERMEIPDFEEVWEEQRERQSEKDRAAAKRLEEMEAAAKKAIQDRRLRRRSMMKETEAIALETKPKRQVVDLSDFDARKAIIYSEILNPPYL